MNKAKKEISGKKIAIIFISVFLALILALVGTLGVISLIREANAIVSLDGATIDKGVASFLISRYKTQYLSDMRSEGYNVDSEDFFESKIGEVSAREHFESRANTYLREILVTSYIFDTYSSLTSKEKRDIEKSVNEVLDYQAGGSVEKFNEIAAEYGFDFDDFRRAATLIYKSNNAFSALYGEDGSRVSSNSVATNSYLNEYAHVYILMVRENTKLDNGENILLNDEERKERQTLLSKIEAAMEAYRTGGDGEMTTTSFENWVSESEDSQNDFTTKGYYFHKDAEMTAEFEEGLPGITECAMKMKLNSFDEVTTRIKIDVDGEEYTETLHCFLYRTTPRESAYNDSDIADVWFSDFKSDLAVYIYKNQINSLLESVKNGGGESEFDYVSIPANITIAIRG